MTARLKTGSSRPCCIKTWLQKTGPPALGGKTGRVSGRQKYLSTFLELTDDNDDQTLSQHVKMKETTMQ